MKYHRKLNLLAFCYHLFSCIIISILLFVFLMCGASFWALAERKTAWKSSHESQTVGLNLDPFNPTNKSAFNKNTEDAFGHLAIQRHLYVRKIRLFEMSHMCTPSVGSTCDRHVNCNYSRQGALPRGRFWCSADRRFDQPWQSHPALFLR